MELGSDEEEELGASGSELVGLRRQIRALRAEVEASRRHKDGHLASMAELRDEVDALKEERDSKMAGLRASVAGEARDPTFVKDKA